MDDKVLDSSETEEETSATFATAEEILALDDLEVVPVYIPEWKTKVRFRVMPAVVAMKFQKELDNPATAGDAWVKIFALCAVNEDGSRMFTDQMLQKLREKSSKVFLRMQTELLVLNGFTKKTPEALKNGSGGLNSDVSHFDSPKNSGSLM